MSQMLDNPDVVDGFVSAALAHIRHVHENGNAALFSEIRAESVRNDAVRLSCECSMDQVRLAFRDYLQAALDRGEIRPAVDLDSLMSVMMAIGEGLVLSDLPSRGISYEAIETMIRAAVSANLRPVHSINLKTSG
jgi:TetR/AcrR family transcriptional repressor of uid operon